MTSIHAIEDVIDVEEEDAAVDTDEAMDDAPQQSHRWQFSIALALMIISMPFYWVKVPGTGLSVLNFTALLFIAAQAARPFRLWDNIRNFAGLAKFAHWFGGAYSLIILMAALAHPNEEQALSVALRAASWFLLYLAVGGAMLGLGRTKLLNTLFISSLITFVSFMAYSEYVFRSLGTNSIAEIRNALSGQSERILRSTIRVIINYSQGEVNLKNFESLSGTVRNSLCAAFAFCCFSSLVSIGRVRSIWSPRIVLSCCVVVATIILVLLLMSRSNLFALIFGFGAGFGVLLLSRYVSASSKFLFFTFFMVLVMSAVVGVILIESEVVKDAWNANQQRLSKISEDPRTMNYAAAWELIREHPWVGYGPGATTPDGLVVHNIVLAAWFECGIAGLFAALLFYAAIIYRWFQIAAERMALRGFPITETIFLPSLAVSPIIRRFIAGDGGRFTLIEYIAMACFFVIASYGSQLQESGEESHREDLETDDEEFQSAS